MFVKNCIYTQGFAYFFN